MAGKEFHCCFKQYQLICLGKDEKSRHGNRGWFSWGWIFKRPVWGGGCAGAIHVSFPFPGMER